MSKSKFQISILFKKLETFLKVNKYTFVLGTLVFITYFNSLNNAFIADDIDGIKNNILIGNIHSVFSSLNFFRPLLYFFIYSLSGRDPFLFRLFNIIIHLLVVFVVFILIKKIKGKKNLALMTASFFAVHPILVESVGWISAGSYPLYSLFFLLSLYFYILSKEKSKYYFISIFCFLLSLMSSEKALIFPVLLIIYEFLFNKKRVFKNIVPYLFVTLPFIIVTYFSLIKRVAIFSTQYHQVTSPYNPIELIPYAVINYIKLIIFPKNLTLYHTESIPQFYLYIYVALFVGFILSLILIYKKNKFLFFFLVFFLITLSPTLTTTSVTAMVAERYAYLPSLGIIFVFSYFLFKLYEKKSIKRLSLTFFVIIVTLLAFRSFKRNEDWKNDRTFWTSTVKTSPESYQAHDNLASVYMKSGEYQKAILELESAIVLQPEFGSFYQDLAYSYQKIGNNSLAYEYYIRALEKDPNLWQSYQNLAAIFFVTGDYKNAEYYNLHAIKINPRDSSLYINLGITYLKMNKPEKASATFYEILKFDPGNKNALIGLDEVKKIEGNNSTLLK